MSLLPTCVVCDALLRGYGGETRCERCRHGCATCGKDPAFCSHPLADELTAKVAAEAAIHDGVAGEGGVTKLRQARCHCGEVRLSDDRLFGFTDKSRNSDWSRKCCRHCGKYEVAHHPGCSAVAPDQYERHQFEPRDEAAVFDSFYCGCRGVGLTMPPHLATIAPPRMLPHLTKPQWDAALDAARKLMNGDIDDAADRAAYRNAKARLVALLPDGTDEREIIKAAVRWDMLNGLAASLAMMSGAVVEWGQ